MPWIRTIFSIAHGFQKPCSASVPGGPKIGLSPTCMSCHLKTMASRCCSGVASTLLHCTGRILIKLSPMWLTPPVADDLEGSVVSSSDLGLIVGQRYAKNILSGLGRRRTCNDRLVTRSSGPKLGQSPGLNADAGVRAGAQ